jgi:DNA-binding FrmR family transcriptional regulator
MTERGYTRTKDDYGKRLNRIEGQVRGVRRMIDEDVYCIDVLTQVSAITKALQAVALGLMDEHVRHCVRHAVEHDEDLDQKLDEVTRSIERLLKT